MIEAWIPSAIGCGALGLVWFGIRGHKKEIDAKIAGLLPEKEHLKLCRIATLEINEHITEEFKIFKKEILAAINGGK